MLLFGFCMKVQCRNQNTYEKKSSPSGIGYSDHCLSESPLSVVKDKGNNVEDVLCVRRLLSTPL